MSIMNQLLLSSFLLLTGLLFITYVVYGRIKRKPLIKPIIGDYKPGGLGYDNFLKIVNNNWYLFAAVAITTYLTIVLVIDILTILNGPYSKAILITPAVSAISFFLILWIIPRALGKKYKNEK